MKSNINIDDRTAKIIELLTDLVKLTDDEQQKEFYQDFLDELKEIGAKQ